MSTVIGAAVHVLRVYASNEMRTALFVCTSMFVVIAACSAPAQSEILLSFAARGDALAIDGDLAVVYVLDGDARAVVPYSVRTSSWEVVQKLPVIALNGAQKPTSVVLDDWDADGELDLFVAHRGGGGFVGFAGLGDGQFGEPHTYFADEAVAAIRAGDFDGDGIRELASIDEVAGEVRMYEASGGPWTLAERPEVAQLKGTAHPGFVLDVDGDGSEEMGVLSNGSAILLRGTIDGWAVAEEALDAIYVSGRVTPTGYALLVVAPSECKARQKVFANGWTTEKTVPLRGCESAIQVGPPVDGGAIALLESQLDGESAKLWLHRDPLGADAVSTKIALDRGGFRHLELVDLDDDERPEIVTWSGDWVEILGP